MREPTRIQEKTVRFYRNLLLLVVGFLFSGAAEGIGNGRGTEHTSGKTGGAVAVERALSRAEAHFEAGRYDASLKGFAVYLESGLFERRTAGILFRAAYAAYRAGRPPLFRKYSARLAKLFPGHSNIEGLAGLNWEVCLMEKNYRAAVREINRLLDLHGKNRRARSDLYFAMARAYEKLYMPEEAVNAYLQVIRNGNRDSNTATALYVLARWAFSRRERELALHYANRLLREFPRSPDRERVAALKRAVRWRYIRKSDGLADDSISDIRFDGDDVWIATWLGGITRFTRSTGEVVRFRAARGGLVSNLVRSLAVTKDRIWAATYAGLSYYDKTYDRWSTIDSVAGVRWQRIKKVLIWDNRVWVATIGHGLSVMDLRTGKWRTYKRKDGLPGNNIVTLCTTPGSIWAGTVAGGIGRLDLRTGRWTVFRMGGRGKLPTNNIKSIAFDGSRVWFGTHGKGAVSCSEQGDDWKLYNTKNSGLSSDYVYSVAVSPAGRVWFGTLEGGAVSYDPHGGKWRRLGIRDGLPGNDIISIAFEGKFIWFGTLNGGVAVLLRDEAVSRTGGG